MAKRVNMWAATNYMPPIDASDWSVRKCSQCSLVYGIHAWRCDYYHVDEHGRPALVSLEHWERDLCDAYVEAVKRLGGEVRWPLRVLLEGG